MTGSSAARFKEQLSAGFRQAKGHSGSLDRRSGEIKDTYASQVRLIEPGSALIGILMSGCVWLLLARQHFHRVYETPNLIGLNTREGNWLR